MSAPTGKQSTFPAALADRDVFDGLAKTARTSTSTARRFRCSTSRRRTPTATASSSSAAPTSSSTGDVFDTTRFPVIDLDKGGSIQGVIDSAQPLISSWRFRRRRSSGRRAAPTSIPGHGRLCEQGRRRRVPRHGHDRPRRVQDLIKKGMTLEQIKAAEPDRGYRTRYGATPAPWTTDMFVEAVYKSLTSRT